jgi:hypothetical protein
MGSPTWLVDPPISSPPRPLLLSRVKALGHNNQKSFPDLPGGVPLVALTEESSDEDDEEEVRKAAVRGMPKAQSLKELRLNSKHIVSQVACLSFPPDLTLPLGTGW